MIWYIINIKGINNTSMDYIKTWISICLLNILILINTAILYIFFFFVTSVLVQIEIYKELIYYSSTRYQ